MSGSPLHSVSVAGAVVAEDGRVLAIRRRDNGHWELPGGVLELDEAITAGVLREVREETGIKVEVDRLTGVYKNAVRGIVALVFRCHPVAGVRQATAEATRVDWLTADQVRERMTEAYAVRLLDALEPHEAPAIRLHDGEQLLDAGQITH